MANTLEELLDRQAIVDVTIDYGWILDHGDHQLLRRVFTDDAHAVLAGFECHGVEPIIAKVDSALNPLSVSQHIITNHQVEVTGDTATSRCYLHAQHTLRGTEGGENFIMAGRYQDELVRTEQGWRIAKRVLTIDWTEGNPAVTGR